MADKSIEQLITVLEHSVIKNGEKPLTNKHLLNILKMIKKKQYYDYANPKCDATEIDIY
jgi:hypothetical protein